MNRRLFLVLLLAIELGHGASAQTLFEKNKKGMDLTSVELVAIFMAEVAACEARDPEFKTQAATPLAQLKRTKRFLEIERSPDFQRTAADATQFVAKKQSIEGVGNCRNTLESIRFELKNFQK